jgi:hypothetical protein
MPSDFTSQLDKQQDDGTIAKSDMLDWRRCIFVG